MAQFPSELGFVSFLQYSVRGQSDTSKLSRDVTYAVKSDGWVGEYRIIDLAARRVAEELGTHPFLADCFGERVTLIPVPRSAPLVSGALWPPLRLCQALLEQGLGGQVVPLLERTQPVQRASSAAPGARPDPPAHYASTKLTSQLALPVGARITLVDDVITRGSSFIGLAARLQEAFPEAVVRCFALVRTQSTGDVQRILDPIKGTISYRHGRLQRMP